MDMTLNVKNVQTTDDANMSRGPMNLWLVLGEKRITKDHVEPLKRCDPKRSVHEEIAKGDTGANIFRACSRFRANAV